jgi:hypothetical protein
MKVSTPPPRNLAQEGRDTLQAQIDLAPKLYEAESKYGPLYAELEVETLRRALQGSGKSKGLLDTLEEISPQISRVTAEQTRAQRTGDIRDVLQLGPQARTAIEAADPDQAALIAELTRQARQELTAGPGLDPSLRREVQQSVRAGQAARGFGFGPSDVFEEAFELGSTGEALRQRRRGFAGQVMGLRSQLYGDPFMTILGRPSLNTAQGNVLTGQAQNMAAGAGPQLFDPFNAYAGDLYNTNYNAQAAAKIASANMKSQLMGAGIGALGSIGGGYAMGKGLGCWVAREVFGDSNPKWFLFRGWLEHRAPALLRWLYLRFGEAFARWIRNKPKLKAIIRSWMERKINAR